MGNSHFFDDVILYFLEHGEFPFWLLLYFFFRKVEPPLPRVKRITTDDKVQSVDISFLLETSVS